jgi:PIN domain nuclease of toxin-antitoxin system
MTLLIDTHVFLWAAAEPDRIGSDAWDAIRSSSVVFLSAVSSWEIAIKSANGKLSLPVPAREYVPSRRGRMGLARLDIEESHLFALTDLPALHRDPFDRLLIAQARIEGLAIVTSDPQIAAYDIETIPAT